VLKDTLRAVTRVQGRRAAIPWDVIERACIAGMNFMDAAKEFGVKEDTIRKRARRSGWPVRRAIGKAVQKAVQNAEVARRTADTWLEKGEAHRAVAFDKASRAIAKADMQPPKSWKEFDLADRAARRAAGLENAEVIQQTLIRINEINDCDEQPIPIADWTGRGGVTPPHALEAPQSD
jgi:hypothetical protein